MHIGFCLEGQKGRDHYEHEDVGGRITRRWALKKYDGVVWARFILLRTGTSGGFL
jgi:hypothetical protein